jgi:dethiobiotin synthetase
MRAPGRPRVRGLFVTGTDTGVGKSVLSGALLAAMAAHGERVRAHKPVVSGLEEYDGTRPPDHELLASIAGMRPGEVAPLQYRAAVSPHLAARLAGQRLDPESLVARAHAALAAAAEQDAVMIVEGVGGLLTPLTDELTVRQFAQILGLPVLVAARPGLGTINHTLLSLEVARAAGLYVRAVVFTPWPRRPSAMERSNRETIAGLGEIEVATLEAIPGVSATQLARAGRALPWQRWLVRAHAGARTDGRRATARMFCSPPARAAARIASLTLASSSSPIT